MVWQRLLKAFSGMTLATLNYTTGLNKRREKERGDRGFNMDKKLRFLEDEYSLG
jgi:hypothetical protein